MSLKIGDAVIYTDHKGIERDALITEIWSPADDMENNPPSVNLMYISGNKEKRDSCGRQSEHDTSVVHEKYQNAHGNKWRLK